MVIWLMLDHFLQNNSSNARYVSSFIGGVTPSLLLACVAAVGLLMLYIVVKHTFSWEINSNIAQDFDEESCDEECIEQKN